MLDNLQQRFYQCFLEEKRNTFSVLVFCRALIFFLFAKIIVLWSLSSFVVKMHHFVPSSSIIIRILFWPAYWGSEHLSGFYSLFLLFLTITLFVKWNSITGFLFFWLVLNMYRLNVPITNGSDIVLLMLVFWSIGMSAWPSLTNEKWNMILILLFNTAVLLCQLQIVFIYLVSGWDKITSEIWRSGDAMSYITHLDLLYNANFGLPENDFMNLLLSWATIVFELTFVILVWFNRTRLTVLAIGVAFHFIIWFMLSLPDFSLVMMISYLIFLKDTDYKMLLEKFRPKPR